MASANMVELRMKSIRRCLFFYKLLCLLCLIFRRFLYFLCFSCLIGCPSLRLRLWQLHLFINLCADSANVSRNDVANFCVKIGIPSHFAYHFRSCYQSFWTHDIDTFSKQGTHEITPRSIQKARFRDRAVERVGYCISALCRYRHDRDLLNGDSTLQVDP